MTKVKAMMDEQRDKDKEQLEVKAAAERGAAEALRKELKEDAEARHALEGARNNKARAESEAGHKVKLDSLADALKSFVSTSNENQKQAAVQSSELRVEVTRQAAASTVLTSTVNAAFAQRWPASRRSSSRRAATRPSWTPISATWATRRCE